MGLSITPIRANSAPAMTAGSADSISSKVSIDLSSGVDQSISITPTNYSITQVRFSEPSTSLVNQLLLTGSLYTGTSKSGTQIITGLPLGLLSGSSTYANAGLTTTAQNTIFTAGTLYINLDNTLSSGTVNVQIFGGTF